MMKQKILRSMRQGFFCKNKCLVCGGKVKNADEWKIEGAIDIRSYMANGKKLYNVTFQMQEGFKDGRCLAEGKIDGSLRQCLMKIAEYFK